MFDAIRRALGVKSLCEIEEGVYSLSLYVKEGTVSLLYDPADPITVEVYDPQHLLQGNTANAGVYYITLPDALRLILEYKR